MVCGSNGYRRFTAGLAHEHERLAPARHRAERVNGSRLAHLDPVLLLRFLRPEGRTPPLAAAGCFPGPMPPWGWIAKPATQRFGCRTKVITSSYHAAGIQSQRQIAQKFLQIAKFTWERLCTSLGRAGQRTSSAKASVCNAPHWRQAGNIQAGNSCGIEPLRTSCVGLCGPLTGGTARGIWTWALPRLVRCPARYHYVVRNMIRSGSAEATVLWVTRRRRYRDLGVSH